MQYSEAELSYETKKESNMDIHSENVRLAMDTISQKPTKGVPSWLIHVMEHAVIEELAEVNPGDYAKTPHQVYLAMQHKAGTCMIDQFIPENPLTMQQSGYESDTEKKATTGAEEIIVDDMLIDSPEAVVEHMEKYTFPKIRNNIEDFKEQQRIESIIKRENGIQHELGPDILKTGYGFISFPNLAYNQYGYENYFCAYALYPEIMEQHFSLQADAAILNNQAAAKAYKQIGMPSLYRLDYDMADSRGTLVNIESLDKIWFPHFARSLEPMLKTDVKMIWHCDGNLMMMVPRLLECGLKGFQGFQYEDGMDYEKICKMKSKDGNDLIIIGGVSVTTTLPFGSSDDVKKEVQWLVDKGPKTGLFLGGSSSIAPGVPIANIKTMVEGFKYFRKIGVEK